jgi:pantoate--beta-alanine ligase
MYPSGPTKVQVTAGELAEQLEGPHRPGHFDGVLTVVTKLFAAVRPDRAYFGEKDYQQLTLLRRMVADLDSPVRIVAVPTVREPDGLALSSRNVFLSAAERRSALALSAALQAGRDAAGNSAAVLGAAGKVLSAAEGVDVDYLQLRDPELGPTPRSGPARLLVAARVGSVRLIDNLAVELAE